MVQPEITVDLGSLRDAIIKEYKAVAQDPHQGFHFHTGRRLTRLVGYSEEWLEGIPESSIEAFAGTGNPFSLGPISPGENIVDVGSGAGIDSLIAARMTGSTGELVVVDI
jgi:arsenite methyltransferase